MNKNYYLIIDGYNFINDIEEFSKYKDVDFEKSREKLIDKMIEYSHYTNEKIIIVFDAYLVKSSVEKIEKRDKVEIIFTKYTQTADSYIEHLVGELGKNITNVIRVVTKDKAEQQIILGKGATRVIPRELYYDFKFMNKKITKKYGENRIKKDPIEERLDKKTIDKLKKIISRIN